MLFLRPQIHLPRRVRIERRDPEAHDQIRPDREHRHRHQPGADDRDIGERVVAGGEEGGAGQAAGVMAEAREDEGAGEVDDERAAARSASAAQPPARPAAENFCTAVHSAARPGTRRMPARTMPSRARFFALQPSADKDQEVDRRVFEEIDAVGEERDGADPKRDGELHAEIGEVQKRDDENGAAQARIERIVRHMCTNLRVSEAIAAAGRR